MKILIAGANGLVGEKLKSEKELLFSPNSFKYH